jgi:hypothetical protein
MGFFSYECRGCGRSLLSSAVTSGWMKQAVAMSESGDMAIGEYDGYGRINGFELMDVRPECWHRSCWEVSGKPKFSKPSPHAKDQGYFFKEEDYELSDPKSTGKLPPKLAPKHSILSPMTESERSK